MRHFVTGARRTAAAAALAVTAALLGGCEPLSITALGVGGSAAVNHKMGNTPARTFTAPLPKVRTASMSALKRMGIKTESLKKLDNGEVIIASTESRDIEVELEVLTVNATRMRVVARTGGGLFYDGSTAAEIIVQTEKRLGV